MDHRTPAVQPTFTHRHQSDYEMKPGIERVQALTDISSSTLCCHSNETRELIANPPEVHNYREPPTILPSYIQDH